MMKPPRDLRPLSQLSSDDSDDDLHRAAALFRSAKAAPAEEMPHLRWRLRASLRQRSSRPRRFLRVGLVAIGLLFTGGMVGAMVRPYWGHMSTGPAFNTVEPSAKAKPQPASRRVDRLPTKAAALDPLVGTVDEPAVENEPVASPVAIHHASVRLAQRRSAAPPIPDPLPPSEAPMAPPTPSPIAVEQALLGDIVRSLRTHHDPRAAFALLEDHAKRFPSTVLAPEVAMLRAEALLGLGRNAEGLAELDHLSLGSMPNQAERLVLRGELRAAAGRWQEALDDFQTMLLDVLSPGVDPKSRDVNERALWGRASARSRLNDEAGSRADLALYLRRFPSGRFATQAATLLRGSR